MANRKKGVILIITLWSLAILSLLAMGLSFRMSIEIKSIGYQIDRLQSRYAAKAGIAKVTDELEHYANSDALYISQNWGNKPEIYYNVGLTKDIFFTVAYDYNYDGEKEDVLYGALDENGKININNASYEEIGRLPGMTREAAASIVDWRDTDDIVAPDGAEQAYYSGLQSPYDCKNGNFQSVEELLLVKGMTGEIYDALKDYVTVYTDGKVNLNSASKYALLAVGLDEALADVIIEFRKGPDDVIGTADDRVFKSAGTAVTDLQAYFRVTNEQAVRLSNGISSGRFTVRSDTFRISSRGFIKKTKVAVDLTAVIRQNAKKEFDTVYWHEE